MINITKQTGRGMALATALLGTVTLMMPRPAHAVSPGWAAAIGLGSFALGASLARPYWGYPAYGYPYSGYGSPSYAYSYGSYPYYGGGYYGYPSYAYSYGYRSGYSPYYGSSYAPYYGYRWGY